MSPAEQARDWARAHVDAVVVLGADAEPWRIVATSGDAVLLRDLDGDRSRLMGAAAVRRAYMAENS